MEFDTLYLEIGARAFSELAAEDSGLCRKVIARKCRQAGHAKPVLSLKKVANQAQSPARSGMYAWTTGRHYVVTMPYKGNAQQVVTVKCDGFTRKGNMRGTVVMGSTKYKIGKKVVALARDVLCEAKWD